MMLRALTVLTLVASVARAAEPASFVVTPRGVEARVGPDAVATFITDDAKIKRPFFANVYTLSGLQVTRNYPPIAGKDPVDHDDMHPGIWLAFGDLGGEDFWRNKGRVATTVAIPDDPHAGAVMETLSLYHAADGRLVARQTTRYTLLPREGGYMIIIDATFKAAPGGAAFGDQEEMGLGVRIATPLTEKNGGRITNSAGSTTAKKTWGKPADWCDYSGVLSDKRIGVTTFAAPSNFRGSWWHTRDYGLMVANAFGRKAMKQGETSHVSIAGPGMRLCYGVLIHETPADKDVDLAAEYRAFCDAVK